MKAGKQYARVVWLNGTVINTVYFDGTCDNEYVRRSLIDHDGYDPGIKVTFV